MKIKDVELRTYRWQRGTPIRNGKHTYTHSGLNLIHIHSDDGLTGIGWCGLTATTGMVKVAEGLLEHFKPHLIGEDPFNYRRIWDALWEPKLVGRARHHHPCHQRRRYRAMGPDRQKRPANPCTNCSAAFTIACPRILPAVIIKRARG